MQRQPLWAAAVFGALLLAPAAHAQATINGVRIYTEPPGRYFQVDGETFSGAADLLWPAGSKHVVTSFDQNDNLGRKYTFKGVTTNLGDVLSQPLTSDSALKWIKLSFDTQYALTLALPVCPDSAQSCPSSGRIAVNGTVYDRQVTLWLSPGSTIQAQAFPNSGYIFTGWAWIQGPTSHPTGFVITFVLNAPQTLGAQFRPAAGVNIAVNLQTVPPNLQVLADRTPYTAPVNLEWGWGTVHALGADPVQYDRGTPYVFESWSDNGPINHEITVPSQPSAPISITARFVPGALITFLTSPPGLALSIDNRQNWPGYNFVWAGGTNHTVSAPATARDSQGRQYRFVSWSNSKPATFTYTVAQPPADDRLTATYEPVSEVTVTSNPAGITFDVDGSSCVTPCTFERASGTQVRIAVPAFHNTAENTRLAFRGWGDSVDTARSVVVSAAPATYVATYQLQHRLLVASNPPDGASFQAAPASADGFYDAGTPVSVAATAAPGFRILSWAGDFSGRTRSANIIMDHSKELVLRLDPIPELAPLGVRNAAVPAIPSPVAPGSLISIFGANLAPNHAAGPVTVLAQALENVSVRVDTEFLPLLYVSPQQINAQLSSGLAPGDHTLTVRWEGKPETSTNISVARNAPGLFTTAPDGELIGLFVRDDGQLVTPQAPARPGEEIRALATGLGPYQTAPPDGFLFNESAGYTLADPVSVMVGVDTPARVLYAGRSALGVGIDAVKFAVPAIDTASALVQVRLEVAGHDSNTVLLPVTKE